MSGQLPHEEVYIARAYFVFVFGAALLPRFRDRCLQEPRETRGDGTNRVTLTGRCRTGPASASFCSQIRTRPSALNLPTDRFLRTRDSRGFRASLNGQRLEE